jgi:hypothetical protein
MKRFLLLALLCPALATAQAPPAPASAGPVPVEVLAGHRLLVFQSVIIKSFAPESKFKFFGLATASAGYQNPPAQNIAILLATAKYEFLPNLSVFGGAGFRTIQGFRPTGGLDYVLTSPLWTLVLKQSVDLSQTHNLQSLALVEYKPRFSEKLGLYSRVQGQYIENPRAPEGVNSHVLSYLVLRLGLDYHKAQFGLAANYNWIGPTQQRQDNYGVFARKEFN